MSLNIALIDLNHMTQGVHTNTVPLGMECMARYLKTRLRGDFDVRVFKDPARFLKALDGWRPDVLGITQYSWNTELNLHMAARVKKLNPACLIVAGGPNLYITADEKAAYLRSYPFVDICVDYDGEIPFAEIVRRISGREGADSIKRALPAGTYSLHPDTAELTESPQKPPRLTTLDVFGAMYADGFVDAMLDEGYHPFLQTQRGCPYRCAYCHTGNDYCSRVIFQSPKYFERDMEYLGRRFAGQHNITLFLSNTNFGLFKEDLEIARVIRRMQDKYDWPRHININSGNNLKRLEEILAILKYPFMPANALQSLTPEVLKNIQRKNVSLIEFVDFQEKLSARINQPGATELIMSLPGETKETFVNSVSTVLEMGVQDVVIYTLMALRGTPIATPETARRYGHVIRHRVVPRCFSDIDGSRIFEKEDVVIGTDAMPFDDYLDLRGLALVVTVFSSSMEMYPLRKLIADLGMKVSEWIFSIHRDISGLPGLRDAYGEFLEETKRELFPSRKSIDEFFADPVNYKALEAGRYGDNLLRKYKTVFLSRHYDACLDAAFSELRRLAADKGLDTAETIRFIKDLRVFVEARGVGRIFHDGYGSGIEREVPLSYDIPAWAESPYGKTFESFRGGKIYSVAVTDYMRDRLDKFRQMNRDPELSVQVLYRDGYIKDFWPVWLEKA
ncbi:MAG: radical SAM protein [Candidatus Omnitrophota bacterium]